MKNYLLDTKELIAIVWIDDENNIKWFASLREDDSKHDPYLEKYPLQKKTTRSLEISLSTISNNLTKEKLLIAYVPIYYQSEFHGFISGIYSIDFLVRNSISPGSEQLFNIIVKEGKENLFDSSFKTHAGNNLKVIDFQFFNKTWSVSVKPKAEFFYRYPILAPHLELMIGIIFSLLIGVAVYNNLISNQRNRKLIEKTHALSKLELEQTRLLSSINESSDFIGMADIEGNLLYHNKAAREMVGLPLEKEMSSMTIADMHPVWFSQKLEKEILPVLFENGSWCGDSVILHQNGEEIPVLQTITLHNDDNQDTLYLTTIIRDITERKRAEAALKVSEEVFRSTMEFAAVGMALVSLDGRFTKVNKSLCIIVGYTETELQNKTFQEITYPDDLETDLNYVSQLLANDIETYQMEKRYIHKNGDLVWILLNASIVQDINKKPLFFIAQIQRIDNQKKIEKELMFLAYHDPLTHLENRKHLVSAFELAIGYAKRNNTYIAIMFLDLDFFKDINDNYGHDVGDLLLIEIASKLKSCKRSNDILVRLGGDEFIFVATELPEPGMSKIVAKRLMAELTTPFEIQEIEMNITISMGISIYPRDGENLDTLLKNADKALYLVKNEGRNNFKLC